MKNIRKQFNRSIRCGTGKAYLIMRDNPHMDFSRAIIKAVTTRCAYFAQGEGPRGEYTKRLIDLSPRRDEIVDVLLKALLAERKDVTVLAHLFELAEMFADEGNEKARRAIYRRYHKHVILGWYDWGQAWIVDHDGLAGLLHVAEVRGRALLKDYKPDENDLRMVRWFAKQNPEIDVEKELQKHSRENPSILRFTETLEELKQIKPKRYRRKKYCYKIIKEKMKRNKRFIVGRVEELSASDIRKLGDDFLLERRPLEQEKYLKIFAETKFPHDYRPLLDLAMGPRSTKHRVVHWACHALAYFEGRDIRRFALDRIPRSRNPACYLYLLVSNYKRGDSKLISSVIERFKNEEIVHSLIYPIVEIYDANHVLECKKPLELMYEKMNCGMHRTDIVDILHAADLLSDRILQEMEFDSFEDTREFHQSIVRERKKRTKKTK